MNKHERAATLAYLCSRLTGNEISVDGSKVYFNDPYLKRIVANAKILLLTPTGRVSAAGVQALNVVAPHINMSVIERSEDYKVFHAALEFPTPNGMRTLVFVDI